MTLKDLIIQRYGKMSEENLTDLMLGSSFRCLWRKGSAIWDNIHDNLETPIETEEFVDEDGNDLLQVDFGKFFISVKRL